MVLRNILLYSVTLANTLSIKILDAFKLKNVPNATVFVILIFVSVKFCSTQDTSVLT